MFEAWRSGARDAVHRDGFAGASWRVATTVALLAIACATPVWLRGYLAAGLLPMLPVLGAASFMSFVVAAVGYPTASLLWVVGTRRTAQVIAAVAGAVFLSRTPVATSL